jgi:UDP-glucose 4-epimerase
MRVLVTGGAGYIGSHAVRRLLADGHTVVTIDNLVRGHVEAIEALRPLGPDRLVFVEGDVGDKLLVQRVLVESQIDTVMHFAALAYVGESVDQPLRYYRNNTCCALSLLEACETAGVSRLVFSSTCATYGEPAPADVPMRETITQRPINPYGMSKLHVEHMLADYAAKCGRAGESFGYANLRYFNVAGSDPDGIVGEDHRPETHLIPIILQAALGQREAVTIFGTDYDTPDGTCVRDYIHVDDLIDAHVRVAEALQPGEARAYNLGIGRGYSVREIIDATRRVTGKEIAVREGARRAGDPPTLFSDPALIRSELGWEARHTEIEEIIATAWRWFSAHPDGYATARTGVAGGVGGVG